MPDPSILVTSPSVSRPEPGARRAARSLYVLEPVPNLDGRIDWATERDRLRDDLVAAGGVARLPGRRRRGRALHRPLRLGAAGHVAGHAVRPRPHVPPDRAVPAQQRRPPRRPGVVFVGSRHGAGRGRADGAAVGTAGRRAGRAGPARRRPMITLEESYERCRQLNRRHGTTYYWSTHLLPKVKRHHVHALYGFCRYADDIVDDLGSTATDEERQRALADFGDRFFADLERGPVGRPGAQGRRPHRQGLRHRPRLLPPVPAVDGDGLHRRHLRDVRRPARLHGRVGGGHRRDDAADPRATVSRRRSSTPASWATPSSCPTSCATWTRTSTGAGSTSPRRTCGSSAPTRGPSGGSRPRGVDLMAFEIARNRRDLRARPTWASPCCRRRRPAASAAPARCTPDPRRDRGRRLRRVLLPGAGYPPGRSWPSPSACSRRAGRSGKGGS